MEKTKKTLMIVSLSTLAICCIMLISAVFGVKIFDGVPLRLLLIFATICVATSISINELAVISRKKVLGYVGVALLALSVLMAFVIFCSNLLVTENVFNRITGIVSVLSVTFIVIISIYSKLGKSLLGLQIPTYVAFGALAILLSLLIGGLDLFSAKGMTEIFVIICIVCFGLLVASTIISAKKNSGNIDNANSKAKTITISLQEYESLKEENKMLKEELEKLKSNNQ